jgi:hypothetical protein
MAVESEQLKAARATGKLSNVITVLREEARAETAKTGPPAREQVDVFEAAVRVSKELSGTRTQGADRRAVLRDVQIGRTIEGDTTKATAVTTKPSPRYATMTDDELQAVDYNNLSSSDLEAYGAELEARTPERPASPNGDGGLDELDLDDNDEIQPGQPLPWESWHKDNQEVTQ